MSRTHGALITALAMLVLFGASASVANTKPAKYHNPVLDEFVFSCNDSLTFVGNSGSDCLPLNSQFEGFYPAKYMKTGMTIRVTLYLSKGSTLLKSSSIKPSYPRGMKLRFKRSKSDFRYRMVKVGRVMRPVWTYHHLVSTEGAHWMINASVPPGQTDLCISAVAVAVGVANAPTQRVKECLSRQE